MSPLLLAALMIVPVLTACSHALTDSKRLIYVTSTSQSVISEGSQSSAAPENSALESSVSADSGTGAKAPKSNSSSGAAANSKKSSGSSGTGSSSSGGNAVIVPLTESEIISLYNDAVAKNTSLQGVEYEATLLINGKKTITEEHIKFNNNDQSPVFDIVNDLKEIYFSPQEGSVDILTGDPRTKMNVGYNSEDLVEYTMILDPDLSASDVNSCSMLNVDDGRVVSIEAVNYADYGGIYKIFSCSGEPISHIDLEYTITGDGFITASCETFILSDGETLEMDKNYINIGSQVNIIKPRTN
jgi:hypothetical protein